MPAVGYRACKTGALHHFYFKEGNKILVDNHLMHNNNLAGQFAVPIVIAALAGDVYNI